MTERKTNIWRCPECHSTTEEKVTTSDKKHRCKSCFRELQSYKDGEENICDWCNCVFSTNNLDNIDDDYNACFACIEKGGSKEMPIFVCGELDFWTEDFFPHYSTNMCGLYMNSPEVYTPRCGKHQHIINHDG